MTKNNSYISPVCTEAPLDGFAPNLPLVQRALKWSPVTIFGNQLRGVDSLEVKICHYLQAQSPWKWLVLCTACDSKCGSEDWLVDWSLTALCGSEE